jgi:Reverse transcriptase (RNA-dependent DNA polymerase)
MDRIVYIMLPIELAEYFPDLAEWFGVPLLLYKSAYGMNSAGRLWAEELFGWYSDYGFLQSSVEPALFTYKKGDDWIILLSYCDDTAYYTSSNIVRQQFETALCSRFECKLLGQLHWFLQARITQSDNFYVTLDQSRYAASICRRFLPESDVVAPSGKDRATYAAPLPRGMTFTKSDCSANYFELKELEELYRFEYPVIIGCLLWILNTYPRLQFPIRKLAKFMRMPGKRHFHAVQHLLHHVRCHHLNGITFYSALISRLLFDQGVDPYEKPFYVFADSSWQDCPDTGRSTGGYHIFMQGGIVDSAMTFPVPVALSSAEAEYNNLCAAAATTAAMGMLVQSLRGLDTDAPLGIPILVDNKACISMGLSVKDSKHTRHIMRRLHYVRYMSAEGFIHLFWVPTDVQVADPTSKSLSLIAPTYVLL